jgi:hypothetical protein
MKATIFSIIAIFAITLTSCTNEAQSSANTTNQDSTVVQVDSLVKADSTSTNAQSN